MGLDDSLLNVPERLRVWQLSGVRYFFLEETPAAASQLPAETPEQAAVAPAPGSSIPAADERLDPPSLRPLPSVSDDVASWPAPWSKFFEKTPPRPSLLFTYAALGLDMLGHGDPKRGRLWRRLIVDLGLSGQKAVAFWPFSLPDTVDTALDLAFFWAGVRLMQPRVLAVFGESDALRLRAFPDASTLRLAVLADPQTLLNDDREAWQHALSVLSGR